MDKATVDPAATITRKRRPGWVWGIWIFFFVTAVWTVFPRAMALSGRLYPIVSWQAFFDYAARLVIGLMNLYGAVLFFMLRRRAYYVLVSAFALDLLMVIYEILTMSWISANGASGLMGAVVWWLISIRIITYARALMKRGVLE